jgi:hypothetical protein
MNCTEYHHKLDNLWIVIYTADVNREYANYHIMSHDILEDSEFK